MENDWHDPRHETREWGGPWADVRDPATCERIGRVPDQGPVEARDAADRAALAQPSWGKRAPRERSDLLRRAHELILREKSSLTELIVSENGKAYADAESEVVYAAEFFRWFAEESVRTGGSYGSDPGGRARSVVTHRPVGVAALVTPWNFPAAMPARKIAPALAAGCTVVLKPPIETPLTALALLAILREAGIPEGVVNIVTTQRASEVVSAWMDDVRVRKISFTGSTRVGSLLLTQAARRIVNASMELGGNAPFIVCPDADLERAVEGAMIAKFRNGGQACTAANRFYVHEDVAEQFVDLLATMVRNLSVGPAVDGCNIGPLISSAAVSTLSKVVDDALEQGARVAARADPHEGPGHFFTPLVLVEVSPDAAILDVELFGPVAPIVTWRHESDLIAMTNRPELGLAAYIYAGRLQTAMRLAESLEAGMVGINRGVVSDPSAPFGGMKQSGLGREGARAGLEEFQETQYFSLDLGV